MLGLCLLSARQSLLAIRELSDRLTVIEPVLPSLLRLLVVKRLALECADTGLNR
ncbi:hypothetical protein D3C72_2549830 [compost metagenome]